MVLGRLQQALSDTEASEVITLEKVVGGALAVQCETESTFN